MITGEIKNKVDQVWNTFWSGGVSNPLSVIEQITYLLFAKRLDDLQIAKEAQANLLGTVGCKMQRGFYPTSKENGSGQFSLK